MLYSVSRYVTLLWCLALTCCSAPQQQVQTHTILTFGTIMDITLYDVETDKAEDIFEQLEQNYDNYHQAWSPWVDGELGRANTAIAAGRPFNASPDLLRLIELSSELYRASEGLFNPAIGKLINLWQMHKNDEPGIRPPERKAIASLVSSNPTMEDLRIDATSVTSNNPDVQLNFGAFAKGYAIDLSLAKLRAAGIDNAIINAGGDLRVIGSHGDRPWKIGIRHPREDGTIASIEAHDNESIFTSGDYERFYYYNGKRYHHILDPRTGYPAEGTASVTVIHENAGIADAAATALFVAGPENWHRIARSMGIKYVMLIDTAGTIYMNPAMQRRIELKNHAGSHIVLSEPL